ncbi:MAG: hypothetical protein OER56_09345 [Hyphomicrobiales bacterium]|nr:hypothetical protein [Hyphomicrobiales bacterium]
MSKVLAIVSILLAAMLAAGSSMAASDLVIGGDVYTSGSATSSSTSAPRDVFAYGFSVNLAGAVGKDAHAAGFDVEVDSSVGADLYVAGGSITVRGRVAEDLSASGFSVHVDDEASVGNNARIVGAKISIDAPIGGSLLAAGGRVSLNAAVLGDVRLTAREIEFGPSAKIDGTLTYTSTSKIDIPSSVISPDRIRHLPFEGSDFLADIKETVDEAVPSFWPSFFGMIFAFLVTLGFFLIVAAVALSFGPGTVERLRARAVERPGITVLSGYFGFALITGLVPASALTLVGLPFIPIVVLLIVVLWLLGYLLGAYAISTRVWLAFAGERDLDQSMSKRLLILATGLVALAILNFILILGWLINLVVVYLGIGSIALLTFARIWPMAGNTLLPQTGPTPQNDPGSAEVSDADK